MWSGWGLQVDIRIAVFTSIHTQSILSDSW